MKRYEPPSRIKKVSRGTTRTRISRLSKIEITKKATFPRIDSIVGRIRS